MQQNPNLFVSAEDSGLSRIVCYLEVYEQKIHAVLGFEKSFVFMRNDFPLDTLRTKKLDRIHDNTDQNTIGSRWDFYGSIQAENAYMNCGPRKYGFLYQ